MATPITIPSNAYIIPVNLSSSWKTFTLPVVSTNAGRMIIFKDMFGNAANSTIRLSTIGLDRIERSNVSSMALSNAFGAWTFLNDGLTNWFLMDAYRNSLFIALQTPPTSTSNLVFSHPDGRTWKVNGTNVRLTTGTTASIWLYNNTNVYSNADGAVGLLNSNDTNQSIRHAGFTMYYNSFTANNFDFAWKFYRSGSGFNIYNYYGGGYYVGYDSGSDQVLIVTSGDSRRVTWNITPSLPSQFIY